MGLRKELYEEYNLTGKKQKLEQYVTAHWDRRIPSIHPSRQEIGKTPNRTFPQNHYSLLLSKQTAPAARHSAAIITAAAIPPP